MDREPEEIQFLGAIGIVVESFKVLRLCLKLLGLITLTLVLPLSFVILAHGLFTEPLFRKIAIDEYFHDVEVSEGSPAAQRTLHQIYGDWAEVLLIELSYVSFVLAFSLMSTSAVVYTVACLYTGKELSYATVISVVPRVWRRLMKTFLWFSAIMFLYYVAVLVVIFLWFSICGVETLNSGVFWFGIVVIVLVLFCVHVYISMVWQLASVVSVVEDKYGMGAMKKSRDLIKGKRGAALALNITYLVTVGIISYLFKSRVIHGGRRNIGVGERSAEGAVLVVVQSAVNVMWLLTQSVLYFVCKSYHHQNIDKSALSDHLEGYLGEYMPLKEGMSTIQLENLDP